MTNWASSPLKLQNVSFLPGSRIGSFPTHPLGQVSDCSGRSPAIRINAMTNIPAQLPPTNATNNHQAEVIWLLPSTTGSWPSGSAHCASNATAWPVLTSLVTRVGKVAAGVVISRSFFGEDRVAVVGSRVRRQEWPQEAEEHKAGAPAVRKGPGQACRLLRRLEVG